MSELWCKVNKIFSYHHPSIWAFERIGQVLNKLENAKNDLNKGKNGKTK